jgi:hypothetical protein
VKSWLEPMKSLVKRPTRKMLASTHELIYR